MSLPHQYALEVRLGQVSMLISLFLSELSLPEEITPHIYFSRPSSAYPLFFERILKLCTSLCDKFVLRRRGAFPLRLVDDTNKNSRGQNGWISPEFFVLRCHEPRRSRGKLQYKNRTRLISGHLDQTSLVKKDLLYNKKYLFSQE